MDVGETPLQRIRRLALERSGPAGGQSSGMRGRPLPATPDGPSTASVPLSRDHDPGPPILPGQEREQIYMVPQSAIDSQAIAQPHRSPEGVLSTAFVRATDGLSRATVQLLAYLVKHGLPVPVDARRFGEGGTVVGLIGGRSVMFSGPMTKDQIRLFARTAKHNVTFSDHATSGIVIEQDGLSWFAKSVRIAGPSMVGPPGLALQSRPIVVFPMPDPTAVIVRWLMSPGHLEQSLRRMTRAIAQGKSLLGFTFRGKCSTDQAEYILLRFFQDHAEDRVFGPSLDGTFGEQTCWRYTLYECDFHTGGQDLGSQMSRWVESRPHLQGLYNDELWDGYGERVRQDTMRVYPMDLYRASQVFHNVRASHMIMRDGQTQLGLPARLVAETRDAQDDCITVPMNQTEALASRFLTLADRLAKEGRCVSWCDQEVPDSPAQTGFIGHTPLGYGNWTVVRICDERRIVRLMGTGPVMTQFGPIPNVDANFAPVPRLSRKKTLRKRIKMLHRSEAKAQRRGRSGKQ